MANRNPEMTRSPSQATGDAAMIVVRGARQHNLKNIDLAIPRNRLVVVTGLSGSGKSTLAFDTLYAEGQRRYVESLSTYARQFLERLAKPDVDLIEGLSPAIAIEQKSAAHNPRSTVGTVTEIYDYLRLLFARVGTAHCPDCGLPIVSQTMDQAIARVLELPEGTRITILAPLPPPVPSAAANLLRQLRREGFARVRLDGQTQELEALTALPRRKELKIEVVVDRLAVKPAGRNRLADSLELAMGRAGGRVIVEAEGHAPLVFTERAVCLRCGTGGTELTPASFSFNSPMGACPHCDGLGATTEIDPALVVPNAELSLREGAVLPWAGRSTVHFTEFLEALAGLYGADIYTAWRELPEPLRQAVLFGVTPPATAPQESVQASGRAAARTFEGVVPWLRRRYLETESPRAREEIERYMAFTTCAHCGGSRLNPASSAVRVGGDTIAAVTRRSVAEAFAFFRGLRLNARQALIAQRIVKEILDRMEFLQDVGLAYLTLDRSAASLSGGESQRIRLATQIGSKLTGVLYVLDEPSIGLHARDNRRLLDTLLRLRDLGNSVLVVEHDEETIRCCDHVIDMGPGAGIHGGQVVFAGTPAELVSHHGSLTGAYLSGRRSIPLPARRRPGNGHQLVLTGASAHNLKHIDVAFPLGCLIVVTGVSGSGKSTLVLDTLHHSLAQHLYGSRVSAGRYNAIHGLEHVDKVINIDQSPIGRTPRSNPGTYTGVFDAIRELFARTPEARARGYRSGRFSFNVKGGRCEACTGDGIVRIEMHFLPDVYVPCDVCHTRRYNRETLEILYRGKSIADVLDMTVSDALSFFDRLPALRPRLQTLLDVGLGYLRLGQPATTLSGGEAQRVKLSRELGRRGTGRTVYILDEPTTGLHLDDIHRLLLVLGRLVEAGNTVIIIEHNLEVIKCADHIIDLGPEGGEGGGRVVGCGTPEQLARNPASHTGRYVKPLLKQRPPV
jgi:excinuclease ABC subunit A